MLGGHLPRAVDETPWRIREHGSKFSPAEGYQKIPCRIALVVGHHFLPRPLFLVYLFFQNIPKSQRKAD